MDSVSITRILIYVHAAFGGMALLSGAISLIATKGNTLHKKSGKLFFFTMLASTSLSLIIAVLPYHKSPFLFCIGLFSSYFIIGGFRSLEFKKQVISLRLDKIIAYLIIVTGIAMVFCPILIEGSPDIILLVFGLTSILFGSIDVLLFRDINRLRKHWLKIHLSKMISGYVAAVTAFVVVNGWLPGVWAWFTPAIFGNIYLTYWLLKLNKKRKISS